MAEHKFFLKKLSFATSVDVIRISRRNATPHSIGFSCISNCWNANVLKGEGLKLTSIFIQTAPMELVVHKAFLLDIAIPCISDGHRTLWAWGT
jgi:hypothetical protein